MTEMTKETRARLGRLANVADSFHGGGDYLTSDELVALLAMADKVEELTAELATAQRDLVNAQICRDRESAELRAANDEIERRRKMTSKPPTPSIRPGVVTINGATSRFNGEYVRLEDHDDALAAAKEEIDRLNITLNRSGDLSQRLSEQRDKLKAELDSERLDRDSLAVKLSIANDKVQATDADLATRCALVRALRRERDENGTARDDLAAELSDARAAARTSQATIEGLRNIVDSQAKYRAESDSKCSEARRELRDKAKELAAMTADRDESDRLLEAQVAQRLDLGRRLSDKTEEWVEAVELAARTMDRLERAKARIAEMELATKLCPKYGWSVADALDQGNCEGCRGSIQCGTFAKTPRKDVDDHDWGEEAATLNGMADGYNAHRAHAKTDEAVRTIEGSDAYVDLGAVERYGVDWWNLNGPTRFARSDSGPFVKRAELAAVLGADARPVGVFIPEWGQTKTEADYFVDIDGKGMRSCREMVEELDRVKAEIAKFKELRFENAGLKERHAKLLARMDRIQRWDIDLDWRMRTATYRKAIDGNWVLWQDVDVIMESSNA